MAGEMTVLGEITVEGHKEYASDYQRMISETNPHLDVRDMRKMCSPEPIEVTKTNPNRAVVREMRLECPERTIIGRNIPGVLGFSNVLTLEKFSGFEIDKLTDKYQLWMVSSNFLDTYSLSIGSNPDKFKIIQKKEVEDQRFFLEDVEHYKKRTDIRSIYKYDLDTKTRYFKIGKDFLKATHSFLKPEYKKKFEVLLI
jgi:hypothetical protein